MKTLTALVLSLAFSACATTSEDRFRARLPRDERTSLEWGDILYDFRYELQDVVGVDLAQDKQVIDSKFTVDDFILEGYKWIPFVSGDVKVLYVRPPNRYDWKLRDGEVSASYGSDRDGDCLAIWKSAAGASVYRIKCQNITGY